MLFILLIASLIVGNLLIAQIFRTAPVRALLNLPLVLPPAALLWWSFGCDHGFAGPASCAMRSYSLLAFPITQLLYLSLLALAPVMLHHLRARRQAGQQTGVQVQRKPMRSKIFSASA